jgi:hypothetical protein
MLAIIQGESYNFDKLNKEYVMSQMPGEAGSSEVEEWERAERNFEVMDRVCGVLSLTHYTEEIREVSISEADRQSGLFNSWSREVAKVKDFEECRQRMGGVALQLVDALVPVDDPRDRAELVEGVVRALKPIDDRLKDAEWDGVIGRH